MNILKIKEDSVIIKARHDSAGCEDGQRGLAPRNAVSEARKGKRTASHLELSWCTRSCPHLDLSPVRLFMALASRTVREYISVVVSPSVCGDLVQHPQEANAELNEQRLKNTLPNQ